MKIAGTARAGEAAGHNLNLHFQAPLAYDVVLEWMDRRVGSDLNTAPPSPCQP